MNTKIDATVNKYNMLSPGDFVVVGVSGGADSMLLLNYLLSVREKYRLTLLVANVEHGIRGEASLKDSEFVGKFCKDNGVEFRMLGINAPEEAASLSMGVEEYSRKRRYEFFASFEPDKIATAHNLSDSVETLIFRLTRGTSLKGACGIPPVRGKIIRPLIECTSDEIRSYCADNGIEYVVDATNYNNDYTRNYIRNVVITDLKGINPSFDKAAQRFINDVSEAEDYISSIAKDTFDRAYDGKGLKLSDIKVCPPALLKRVIVLLFEKYGITADSKHIEEAVKLVFSPSRYQLKGTVFAVSDGEYLRIADFRKNDSPLPKTFTSALVDIKQFNRDKDGFNRSYPFICDADKICGDPYIRYRQEGDKITPAERGVTKTLKKLFNEYKIPPECRERIPLICDGDGIIGIYGYCVDERVKIHSSTNTVFLLTISTEDNNK